MAFLLVMVVLSLGTTIREQRMELEDSITSTSAIVGVSGKFNNIINDVVAFDKNNFVKDIQKRILPFNYSIDYDLIRVHQELPVKSAYISNYFDVINIYSIFVEDENPETTYDLMVVDTNTLINTDWPPQGKPPPSQPDNPQFMIWPQCLKLVIEADEIGGVIQDSTYWRFEPGLPPDPNKPTEGCASAFDSGSVDRYDVNMSLMQYKEYYNTIECEFFGCQAPCACPTAAYGYGTGLPYFKLTIDDSRCQPNCKLGGQATLVSSHYDPTKENSVTISCEADLLTPNCYATTPITIVFGNDTAYNPNKNDVFRIGNSGGTVDVDMNVTFASPVDQLRSMDFNVRVHRADFNITIKNVDDPPA